MCLILVTSHLPVSEFCHMFDGLLRLGGVTNFSCLGVGRQVSVESNLFPKFLRRTLL